MFRPESRLISALRATILVSLLFGLGAPALAGPEQGRISGKIVNAEGEAIVGITVKLTPMPGSTGVDAKAETNKKGKFIFPNCNAGGYSLSLEGGGYALRGIKMVARNSDGSRIQFEEELAPGAAPPGFEVGYSMRATIELTVEKGNAGQEVAVVEAAKDASPKLIVLNELFEAGDWEGLQSRSREVVAENPELGGAHYLLGVACMRLKELSCAVDALRSALELSPDQPAIQGTVGTALVEYGNSLKGEARDDEAVAAYGEAIAYLEGQLVESPGNLTYMTNRIVALEGAGKIPETIAAIEELIELDPESERAYLRMAELLSDQGRADEAIAVIEGMPATGTAGATVIFNVAVDMWNAGKMEATIAAMDKAISIAPEMAELYQLKGRALISNGDTAAGVAALREYIARVPEDDPSADSDRALIEALADKQGG